MQSRSPTQITLRQPVRYRGRIYRHAALMPEVDLTKSFRLTNLLGHCPSVRDQANALIATMTSLPIAVARKLSPKDVHAICTALDQQVSADG